MKTPSFWYQPPRFLSTFLWPLSWIYGKGGKTLSLLKKSHRFPVPILSVGNIVCGGAGKTPLAIALARLLQTRGINVHFVTRGYGGTQKGPLKINPSYHTSVEVGDEPLLLAQQAPTWIAKERPLGVQKAMEEGAHLIILDDGHQTSGLYKDLSFVVVDLLQRFGNGYVIPAGPLREDLAEGLKRSDALIGIGEGEIVTDQPFFRARSVPHPLIIPSNRVIAFCGLGFPQKFYKTLQDLEVDLIAIKSFPDHYRYQKEDLVRLQKMANENHAVLVTTQKDKVKIPSSWHIQLHVLDISIQFEDSEGIYEFILQKIPFLKEAA